MVVFCYTCSLLFNSSVGRQTHSGYYLSPFSKHKNILHTIKWLLSEIDKTDSTIFVINKMDEVADLEDNTDFLKNSRIKR